MGQKEKYLEKILDTIYQKGYHKALSFKEICNHYNKEIFFWYKKLGGIQTNPKVRRSTYDIVYKDFIVELDEQLHFNRYRKLTLQAELYKKLPTFPKKEYLKYCDIYELDCLEVSNREKTWKSSNTEKQFGISSDLGDINEPGSSRWKQRAFYDYLKDISQLISGVKIIRISIWDSIELNGESYKIKDLLEKQKEEELRQFISQKMIYEGIL